MDKTYIKVKGKWCYLYRAVDKSGATTGFMCSKNCDKLAAKRFFNKAIGYSGRPDQVTIDKSCANNAALKSINKTVPAQHQIAVWKIKYLNNIIEQDHRFIKHMTKPMMGFKEFHSAHATLIEIDPHHILHKDPYCHTANMPVFKQFYALAA